MITLSLAHTGARADAALQATLTRLNAGATGAILALYSSVRPATGATPGGAVVVSFTLPKPAGTITLSSIASNVLTLGTLTLGAVADALIAESGIVLWGRITVAGIHEMDVSVSDTAGVGTIRLSTTQLFAGGTVRLASGTFS